MLEELNDAGSLRTIETIEYMGQIASLGTCATRPMLLSGNGEDGKWSWWIGWTERRDPVSCCVAVSVLRCSPWTWGFIMYI